MENRFFKVALTGRKDSFLNMKAAGGGSYSLQAPEFEVDGRPLACVVKKFRRSGLPSRRPRGALEHRWNGALSVRPDLNLEVILRIHPQSPFLRYRYILRGPGKLTKVRDCDSLSYGSLSFKGFPQVQEIRLSEFLEQHHSYGLREIPLEDRHFEHGLQAFGPLLAASDGKRSLCWAYEHGSTVPDAFVNFELGKKRDVGLKAVKGNYFAGQSLEQGYKTIWFQLGVVKGGPDNLAAAYREFVLKHWSENTESRQPYLFYNTWNYQERNHAWNKKPYLESMHLRHILGEIETAHRMGVDLFVIDTGWFGTTGDWQVNLKRFPDGLKTVRAKLESYGMKMGLWFAPQTAAETSQMMANHRDCRITWRGQGQKPSPVWETEESSGLCLVSRYWQAFADELIRLYRELGVAYFKWDAVSQYGCDDPNHGHGSPENSAQERADCYAFQLPLAMNQVVKRIQAACPQAIVDYDLTEAGRSMGLAWLEVSKYFFINNGPYYQNYNLPPAKDGNWNMFFWPGPARGWILRKALDYDRWIPSVLFMAHFLPDDPASSRLDNFGSMALGFNGMWGDLPNISKEAAGHWGLLSGEYKKVRDAITAATPVISGGAGSSVEIREKLADDGRGMVVCFATAPGTYRYVTSGKASAKIWESGGVRIERDKKGRAVLEFEVTAEEVTPGGKRWDPNGGKDYEEGLYDWSWSSTFGGLGGTAKIVFFN
jgi:alpha-galactosidase